MPECITCGNKNPKNFHKDPDRESGYRSNCDTCASEYMKKWRKKNRKHMAKYKQQWYTDNKDRVSEYRDTWRKDNPDRHAAHGVIRAALGTKEMKVPKLCEKCGKKRTLDSHHPDYKKPDKVLWVCRDCHNKLHKEL